MLQYRRRIGASAFLLSLCLILLASTAYAASEQSDWQPPPPMPDEWDWIQLTSDEWLKGELIAMYDRKLEFDSDELDLLEFDWADVKQVRTAETMQVALTGDAIAVGKLLVDGDTIRVIGAEDRTFPRHRLISIAAGEPKERNYWSGKIALGANIRRGNSDIIEYNASLRILRRTALNRTSFDYIGNYNVTEDVEAANNHRFSASWDKFLSRRLFVTPVSFEWFIDPFQNINHRETFGAGVGYELVNDARTEWNIGGGLGYQRTSFSSVESGTPDSADTPALIFSTDLDVEVSGWLDFIYAYRFQIVNEDSGRYNHHMLATLETEITKLIDFDVTLIWDRIQKPREDDMGVTPEQDDLRLVVALVFDF